MDIHVPRHVLSAVVWICEKIKKEEGQEEADIACGSRELEVPFEKKLWIMVQCFKPGSCSICLCWIRHQIEYKRKKQGRIKLFKRLNKIHNNLLNTKMLTFPPTWSSFSWYWFSFIIWIFRRVKNSIHSLSPSYCRTSTCALHTMRNKYN